MHTGGRTKHTEDVPTPRQKLTETRQQTARRVSRLNLVTWMIVTAILGVASWLFLVSLMNHMAEPERDRRVRACAVAMEHEEYLSGPLEPCESLSPAERRSAAYEYGRMRGLW